MLDAVDAAKKSHDSGLAVDTLESLASHVRYSWGPGKIYPNQCFGSRSGILCFLTLWSGSGIFVFSGSRIPNPCFWELNNNSLALKCFNKCLPVHVFYLSQHRHMCHNFQYFWQYFEFFGEMYSLALHVVEMYTCLDPPKWCPSDGSWSTKPAVNHWYIHEFLVQVEALHKYLLEMRLEEILGREVLEVMTDPQARHQT